MRTDTLQKWLEDNNMEIVWQIGVDKKMVDPSQNHVIDSLSYSGLFKYEDGKPVGSIRRNKNIQETDKLK